MSDETEPLTEGIEPQHDEVNEDRSEPETGPHLVLELEGDRQLFEAKGQKANQMLLVKYVDGLASTGYQATNSVVKLALGQVKDPARLEAYLELHGFAEDFDQSIYDALEACWRGETMLPLARS